MRRGPFSLQVPADAPLAAGNRRLVVIWHGSPGSPWVHADRVAWVLGLHAQIVALFRRQLQPPPLWGRPWAGDRRNA